MSYDPLTRPETIDPLLTEMLRLRCEGHSYVYIAAMVGINTSVVKRKLAAFAEEQKEQREEMVQKCSDQLDYLWRRQLEPYCSDELRRLPLPDKTAMTLLKIQEQKAKLLGLNAPTRTENAHSFDGSTDADLILECQRLGIPIPPALESGSNE